MSGCKVGYSATLARASFRRAGRPAECTPSRNVRRDHVRFIPSGRQSPRAQFHATRKGGHWGHTLSIPKPRLPDCMKLCTWALAKVADHPTYNTNQIPTLRACPGLNRRCPSVHYMPYLPHAHAFNAPRQAAVATAVGRLQAANSPTHDSACGWRVVRRGIQMGRPQKRTRDRRAESVRAAPARAPLLARGAPLCGAAMGPLPLPQPQQPLQPGLCADRLPMVASCERRPTWPRSTAADSSSHTRRPEEVEFSGGVKKMTGPGKKVVALANRNRNAGRMYGCSNVQ